MKLSYHKQKNSIINLVDVYCNSPYRLSSSLWRRHGDDMAYASGKSKKHNDSVQSLEQFSETGQVNTCDSTYNTIAGCNNLDFTVDLNDGNNEAGQQ